jgi:phage tail-like protein
MNTDNQGQYFVLDPAIQWLDSEIDSLSPVGDCGLAVDCVPGQPIEFAPALMKRMGYPVGLAVDHARENLYLLDLRRSRANTLNLAMQNQEKPVSKQLQNQNLTTCCTDQAVGTVSVLQGPCGDLDFSTLSGVGGRGRGARQLLNPRGIAVLADAAVAIADTGNHQVKIFSRFPHALLAVWGSGKAGDGVLQFKNPWKVVGDSCGLIYVADRGNGRVQRIQRDGTPRVPITGLHSPSGLALGPDGTLAVLDEDNVLFFAKGKTTQDESLPVPDGNCLTFDGDGYLYVGTTTGLIYKFAPSTGAPYRTVGIGVTGRNAELLDLLWTQDGQLLCLLIDRCAKKPGLWSVSTCGSFVPAGMLISSTLDSGIEGCAWHRIGLDASVPDGTTIEVATQTADTDIWAKPTSAPFQPASFSYSSADTASSVSLTGKNPDCLVQSRPGRYLRVRVKLQSNGVKSPVLRRVRVYFPRESYLQYLPAVYQEDDESRLFLERFLSIFQSTFDGLDQNIDDLWMMFDPKSVPDKWFSWLAQWVALPINPLWTDVQRRVALKKAGAVYPQRGTAAGIEELIKEYCDVDARLVEHFRLRQLLILSDGGPGAAGAAASYVPQLGATTLCGGGRLWSRDYYQRLQVGVYSRIGYSRLTGEPEPGLEPLAWGANEFSVFFNCEPYQIQDTQKKVAQVVEREKPAYTKANYCPVLPRMRVGVQSTLGVDSRIGVITPLLLGTTGTLGYDSILGCDGAGPGLGGEVNYRPQVDVNTRLQ